ncbi:MULTISPECIES: LysR family transcriptional regulator [Pseudomonas]|uniref:LysR family transcriptional regulator n=1 Tax=Pseudomonas TaxID=286 RepID=UPI0030090407
MDTLQTMRAFVCVAETGSFSCAAKRLGCTNSYVSRAIATLEAHLQTRLLNRTTRQIALTEAGQRYLSRCEHIFLSLELAAAEASDMIAQPVGKLRVHSMTGVGLHYIVKAIAGYRKLYPGVNFEMTMANRVPDLVEEGFDVSVVLATEPQSSDMVWEQIGETYGVLCASPLYIEEHSLPTSLQDLTHHQCLRILSRVMTLDSWIFTGLSGEEAVEIRNSPLTVNHGDAMLRAIQCGMGVGILPIYSAQQGLQDGTLIRVLSEYKLQSINIYALYQPREHLDAKIRTWISYLRKSFPEMLNETSSSTAP